MGSALTEDFAGNNVFNNTGKTINTYKVKGVDELITTETKNGIERVIDIAKCSYDSDGDGIEDVIDPDDDNDGVLDVNDAFPFDPNKSGDNDGDGVDASVDIDDNNPAVGSSTLNKDFFISLDLYGKSGSFELKSNGEVRKIGVGGGIIDVYVELNRSAIGWSEDLEYRAYVVDTDDGSDWATLTGSIGTPVEIDDTPAGYRIITRGDLLLLTIQPTSDGNRKLDLRVDLYHKPTNTKVATTAQRISQSSSVTTEPIVPDNTPIPDVTVSSNIDNRKGCSNSVIYPILGGKTFPQVIESTLGSDTGEVQVYFNPQGKSDRLILMSDGNIVLDTGYVTWFGSSTSQQAEIDKALIARGVTPSTVQTIYSATGTNQGPERGEGSPVKGTYYGYTWNKTSTNPKVYAFIYAPIERTKWEFAMACPGQTLKLSFSSGSGGG
jgi:hypothetical protein